ncbi:hypothetical protein [Ovoidimarina sediminis]|uniref:hypothetical protein n=1 Tax=Ovoidimarina sediminis TaxID=3079856 RepID=UPI00290E2746|nr:hypothetical protein [Rhodophyticola sp. MJ-SS7]MDU8943417.1 hypothetical protein [Rhodophyticola sp. MJ-SS7]
MKSDIFRHLAAGLAAGFVASAALAGQPVPVMLQAIEHQPAQLEVIDGTGARLSFAPSDLETLPTYQMVTKTSWREAPAQFEGVLLSDLLRETGLYDVPAIQVTAENDYTTIIPRAAWQEIPILVATRVDGEAHTRRARGPIQFVIDMEIYETSEFAREEYMVWMASRLEAAN